MIIEKSFFNYYYIAKDNVLQILLQWLICQPKVITAELFSSFETEEEIINNQYCNGRNKYFNNLPLKYKLYLIITFIKGISNQEIVPEGLDNNLYLTVDHLFGNIYDNILNDIDNEVEYAKDKEWEKYKYNYRECFEKCAYIMNADLDPPEKSILVLDKICFEKSFDEDGKEFDSNIIIESWDEACGYLQGQLFGGYRDGEFGAYKDHISNSIEEQKILYQFCSPYSILELTKKYYDTIWEYGNIDFSELKKLIKETV